MEVSVDSLAFHLFILVLSIFSLISDDIRYLFLPSTVDSAFQLFNELVFIIFFAELVLNCLYEKNFWGTFYFYLDFVALVSVMTEVQFIWGPISQAIMDDNEDPNMISNNVHLQRVNYASNTSSA
jgi:hypothetical protein